MEEIRIDNNEEFLRQVSTEVDFDQDDYLDYINKLKEYCQNNSVYALSAVQIGIPKRIMYIKNTSEDMNKNVVDNYDESLIFINPRIIKQEGLTKFLEGCYSCSYEEDGKRIYYTAVIERPYLVEIEYYDINGVCHTKTLEDFAARVFRHEYDHFDGIFHMDRASEVFKMTKEKMKDYRAKHPQDIISKDCKFIDTYNKNGLYDTNSRPFTLT